MKKVGKLLAGLLLLITSATSFGQAEQESKILTDKQLFSHVAVLEVEGNGVFQMKKEDYGFDLTVRAFVEHDSVYVNDDNNIFTLGQSFNGKEEHFSITYNKKETERLVRKFDDGDMIYRITSYTPVSPEMEKIAIISSFPEGMKEHAITVYAILTDYGTADVFGFNGIHTMIGKK